MKKEVILKKLSKAGKDLVISYRPKYWGYSVDLDGKSIIDGGYLALRSDTRGSLAKFFDGISSDIVAVVSDNRQIVGIMQEDVDKVKAAVAAIDAKEKERVENLIKIDISSRGWGDYSPLVWSGDRRLSDEEILEQIKAEIASGSDLDQPNQSDADLMAKIAAAKGAKVAAAQKEVEEITARIEKLNRDELPSAAEAKRRMAIYNNVHNEGGEGYVPHIVSREEYDSLVDRKNAALQTIKAEAAR